MSFIRRNGETAPIYKEMFGGPGEAEMHRILLGAETVDLLCVGVDVLGALADRGNGLHNAVLRTQNSGSGTCVNLSGVLAAKDLQPCGAKENARCEQSGMLHNVFLQFIYVISCA